MYTFLCAICLVIVLPDYIHFFTDSYISFFEDHKLYDFLGPWS